MLFRIFLIVSLLIGLAAPSIAKPADGLHVGYNRAAIPPRLVRQFDNLSGVAATARWPSRTSTLKGYKQHGQSVGANSSVEYDLSARQTVQHGKPYAYLESTTGKKAAGYKSSTSDKFTAVTKQDGTQPQILEHYQLPRMAPNARKQFAPGVTSDLSVRNTDVASVVGHLRTHGKLPNNFITKTDAELKYGWQKGKPAPPGRSIGGDIYNNDPIVLPDAQGRQWRSADINYQQGNKRNGERLLYSNDGLIYYNNKSVDELFYEVRN